MITRRSFAGTLSAGALADALSRPAVARPALGPSVTIGVLSDQSGPYRDISGPLALACAQQAIADFNAPAHGLSVRLLTADHHNDPASGAAIAAGWIGQEAVDVIVDCPNSGVALAVADLCRAHDRLFIASAAASTELTGRNCAPTTLHWAMDSWMLAHSTGSALVRQGGDTWFIIAEDDVFGRALARDTAEFVNEAGGEVMGSAVASHGGADLAQVLGRAEKSGAKVLAVAAAGSEAIRAIREARAPERGIEGVRVAGLLVFISDVHSLGLEIAGGLILTESFYWNFSARTRGLSRRLSEKIGDRRIGTAQAATYAGVLHYLKAVAGMASSKANRSGAALAAKMKSMPTDDDAFGGGIIRADGRVIHPTHLFQVKTEDESSFPWDYYRLLATTPADAAFRPLAEGGCAMIKS